MHFDLTLASLFANTLFILFFVMVGISFMIINIVFTILPLGRAPFVPTPQSAMRHILTFAGVNEHSIVYDLGSGDGRLILAAAEQFHAPGVGIERNLFLTWYARLRASLKHLPRARFIHGNLFSVSLTDADIVLCYLLPAMNKKLSVKLATELKPGARVISRKFSFPDWVPTRIDPHQHLFMYTMPPVPSPATP